MRLLVFAVVLSTAVAAPALAGTVITSVISAPNVAGNSVVYYIEPDRVRMEYPGHIVIFRADQDTAYVLALAKKKFQRMTPETMKQSAVAAAKDRRRPHRGQPKDNAGHRALQRPEAKGEEHRVLAPSICIDIVKKIGAVRPPRALP
jgi:hypothetical protein